MITIVTVAILLLLALFLNGRMHFIEWNSMDDVLGTA